MRTITFYSYKGGVGRSLLVANAAKYLSTLGKSVFALDLDLEAPGLHYKFELGTDIPRSDAAAGIVDILVSFLKRGTLPRSLAEYASSVEVAAGSGPILVMRAGTAPSGDYWRLLSQVNWYEIFYGSQPVGAPFFLELKERIRLDFNPDFLLVDARTGVSEMGGIATTLLPDTVVCLALASAEHLEGLRAAMQGIKQTTARQGETANLVAVISRLPVKREEAGELSSILAFLNSPVREGAPGLELDELVTLHSEPLLDSGEQLLVGGKNSPHDLPLLRDYLRLFSKIIPAEEIRPHVGELIRQAISRILDDPDGAQSDLEALTAYCADQEAYRALLKLYQVRKVPPEKIISTAALMWQLAGSSLDPDKLLIDIVRAFFSESRPSDVQKKHAEFAEAVWRSTDMKDIRVLMTVVTAYLPEHRDRAIRLLADYIDKIDAPNEAAIVRLIDLLRTAQSPERAMTIVDRFKGTNIGAEFHAAWARLVADQKNRRLAQDLLDDEVFRLKAVRAEDPPTAYRLLKLVGHEDAELLLVEAIDSAVDADDLPQLRALGLVFSEEGRLSEFELRLERFGKRLSPHFIEELTASLRGRRRSRMSVLR